MRGLCAENGIDMKNEENSFENKTNDNWHKSHSQTDRENNTERKRREGAVRIDTKANV